MITYTALNGRPAHGDHAAALSVPNANGYRATCPVDYTTLFAAASAAYAVPLALLLVQCCQESAFHASAVSFDGGYGLGQWTYEPLAREYLGVPTGDWHAAALDPARSINATARYARDSYRASGSWQAVLGGYNGGGNWASIPAARAYADGILAHARTFEAEMALAFGLVPPTPPPPPPASPTRYRVLTQTELRATPDLGNVEKPIATLRPGDVVEHPGGTGQTPHWLYVTFGHAQGYAFLSDLVRL